MSSGVSVAGAPAESPYEAYLAAGADAAAFSALTKAIKQLIEVAQFDDAATLIRRAANPSLDYTSILSLVRLFKKVRGRCKPASQKLRLAVLSSFTANQLVEIAELFLFAGNVDLELYEADYGVFRQEILDPSSRLYSFKPATVLIATTWRDLAHVPKLDDDAQTVDGHVADELNDWSLLWQTLHDRLGCQILQNNFDRPAWQPLSNHENRHHASFGRFVSRVNQRLVEKAPPFVTIHDLDALSANVGRQVWNDEQYFLHAKFPCAPECLVTYGHSLASVLMAQKGLVKKCLVLDLDNTVWGGIIGDDGMAGIRLGQGDPEGEAFAAFQTYVQKLRERGVILAVCSKNTHSIAWEAFCKHPGMVLRGTDIACFTANWDDKAANLRNIATELNIGIDSLVFIDDNPVERAIVRQLVPEVSVPEVSTDPLDFIRALEQNRYFQLVGLGKEDLQRTAMYAANAERKSFASSAVSIADFLASLEMVATVGPITELSLERSTQLINKSNQFNLTTIRRSAADVLAIARDPGWFTQTVSLKDRFGDNGLISVLLARVNGDALEIDTWLMSCRVLKRNVEQLLLNIVCTEAARRGLKRVRGKYIPTAKNALVKDHYSTLGFEKISEQNGEATYELDLSKFEPFETCIQVIEAS